MRHWCAPLLLIVMLFPAALPAQHRSDTRYRYHRLIAVLPAQGAGTAEDPVRPKHAPRAQAAVPNSGIIAFACVPSDDGKHFIVEFVAIDRAALADVFADHEPGVLVFEKGVAKNGDIEAAIRPFRKDFSLRNFGAVIQ